MTAPSIIREDSFVTAMPSSLLEEIITISRPMITPCKDPASDRSKPTPEDKGERWNTGSRMTVTANAPKAGNTMREI